MSGLGTVGILVGGGPAPGINGVIGAATLAAHARGSRVVGIVEASTHHEGWHVDTHRLNEQVVIDDFIGAGFELVESSDILANPEDDHSGSGFQEGRYNQDRYLLKFQKPAA